MFQRDLFIIGHTNTTTTSNYDNTTQIITVTDSVASELPKLCALISLKIFADMYKNAYY
jgi:hypothetical protein